MGRCGDNKRSDDDSWGQRTGWDADRMRREDAQDSLGICQPASSEDVCDAECAKWDRQWRNESLATKGLRDFNGTGETAEDGVAYTEAMYDKQSVGKNYGRS